MKKIFSLILCLALLGSSMLAFSSCGDKDDEVETHTHSLTEWTVETAATCTAGGVEKRECTSEDCDYSETRKTSAVAHTLFEHEGQSATCTAIGWEAYVTCSQCSYTTYKESPATGHKYIVEGICQSCGQQHVHNYGDWFGNSATCASEGNEYHSCLGCGYIESRVTSALDHEFEEGVCVNCSAPDPDYDDNNDYVLPSQPFGDN